MIEGRAARDRRRRSRRRRQRALAILVLGVGLVLGAWVIAKGTSAVLPQRGGSASGNGTDARAMSMARAAERKKDPTPVFAAYGGIEFRVPVPCDDLVDIAFHQASYSYARHLKTQLPTWATDDAANKKGTGRTVATNVADAQGWLTGYVLRLWRNRPGSPDSAADVGAPAGSPVLAPVTGTVLLVKRYKLYEKYDDVQIHIRPEGHSDLDVVLIHIIDPTVEVGDLVTGGVTPIGAVRRLSNRMHLQLSDFVPGDGDHTHMQLNKVKPGTTEPVTSS